MKLLVVDDEEDLAMLIAKGLRKKSYAVDIANDGKEALYLFQINEYDLLILDLNIPIIDGFSVLKTIRKTNSTLPVLILSARVSVQDRIQGLDLGSNDYLTKPFDFAELEARVRALLRRKFIQEDSIIQIGNLLSIDTTKKRVDVGKKELKLTSKEYSILEYLGKHKNEIVSSETLLEHVWDSNVDLFSNPLKYHIHALKKKLAATRLSKNIIENIRGQGYRLNETEETLNE